MPRIKSKHAQEAASLLENLQEGKPGLPDPEPPDQGKPGLPDPDDESWYDPDVNQDDAEREASVSFSEKDRAEFARLERQVDSGTRQAAEALRAIRSRQLWRLESDEQGGQRYANFEAYCQDRWGHSRQWATQLTNWLRAVEEGERAGIAVSLTVKAAQGLLTGRLKEAGGLQAVLGEAQEDGAPLDRESLREIVNRRADYNYYSEKGEVGVNRPAAPTYGEYKADLETAGRLGKFPADFEVVTRAKELDGDFATNLVSLCRERKVVPPANRLVAVLTGEALADVVARLKVIGEEHAEIAGKMKLLATRRKQLREMQKESGLKTIREEAKALERELKAKGGYKPRGSTPPQGRATHGVPAARAAEDGDGEDAVPGVGSEVRTNLETALDYLDEAATGEWPTDEAELSDIRQAVRDCEDKLAVLAAKVKQLLPDIEQVETVLVGNE